MWINIRNTTVFYHFVSNVSSVNNTKTKSWGVHNSSCTWAQRAKGKTPRPFFKAARNLFLFDFLLHCLKKQVLTSTSNVSWENKKRSVWGGVCLTSWGLKLVTGYKRTRWPDAQEIWIHAANDSAKFPHTSRLWPFIMIQVHWDKVVSHLFDPDVETIFFPKTAVMWEWRA